MSWSEKRRKKKAEMFNSTGKGAGEEEEVPPQAAGDISGNNTSESLPKENNNTAATVTIIMPQRNLPSNSHTGGLNYTNIKIYQNPIHGKALGFKQLFGSFLDPTFIIGLTFDKNTYSTKKFETVQYLCSVNLIDADSGEDRSTIDIAGSGKFSQDEDDDDADASHSGVGEVRNGPGRNPIEDNLKGIKQANGRILLDPADRTEKLFFIFPELSIRIRGHYKLVGRVYEMGRTKQLQQVLTSDPFRVLSPRNYPGMSPITDLSRAFAKQGVILQMGRRRSWKNELPNPNPNDSD